MGQKNEEACHKEIYNIGKCQRKAKSKGNTVINDMNIKRRKKEKTSAKPKKQGITQVTKTKT